MTAAAVGITSTLLGIICGFLLSVRMFRHRPSGLRGVTVTLPIPSVESADGSPIEPDDLRAVSWRLACQANALASHMHAVAVECVIAQVAADEAAATDLDQLLKEGP